MYMKLTAQKGYMSLCTSNVIPLFLYSSQLQDLKVKIKFGVQKNTILILNAYSFIYCSITRMISELGIKKTYKYHKGAVCDCIFQYIFYMGQ